MEVTDNTLWIARDEDGSLYLYWHKPERDKEDDEYGSFYIDTTKYLNEVMHLDYRMYPEITWENSPQLLITPVTGKV